MSYSTEELSCNWLELPRDVMARIFSRLGPIEILSSVQLVCSQWWSICNEPSLWRTINVHNKGDLWEMEKDAEVMCRRAIDRSCGRLADINIEYFGSDELLDYITARSFLSLSIRFSLFDNILIFSLRKMLKLLLWSIFSSFMDKSRLSSNFVEY